MVWDIFIAKSISPEQSTASAQSGRGVYKPQYNVNMSLYARRHILKKHNNTATEKRGRCLSKHCRQRPE